MAVRLTLHNQSGLPLRIVAWPCRTSDAADAEVQVRPYSFAYWEEKSVPEEGFESTDQQISLGELRKCHRVQMHEHYGWVFFDLLRADGSALHLQAFLHLNRSGIENVKIGRLDLDSTASKPMPSGELGSVEPFKADDAEVHVSIDQSTASATNEVDDSTHAGHLPGKGVETSTYISHRLSSISLIVGNEARYHEADVAEAGKLSKIRSTSHRVEGMGRRTIGAWLSANGKHVFSAELRINPLDGSVNGAPFANTRETVAVYNENPPLYTFNYGFSGQGISHHDQVYAYLTPSYANWLGDLIEKDAERWRNVPFSTLVLPAAHDAGMWEPLDPGLAALITSGKLGDLIKNKVEANLESKIVHGLIVALESVKLRPERVLMNIANTQKDSFANQLRTGVRFFDFRPGFNFADAINNTKGIIRHQHAMVPGCAYLDFLIDVLHFLESHPREIVFFEIKSSGIILPKDTVRDGKTVAISMIPSVDELNEVLDEARSTTGSKVVIGSAPDLDTKLGELIDANKRLIIVDKVHEPDAWSRDDSYDHHAYNTTDPATIIAALDKKYAASSHPDDDETASNGKPRRGCIYQFQATPTSNIGADLLSSITFSDCSSLLVWMKARMERVTYPWIAAHHFKEPGNVILLNDFVDTALVEHAVFKSIERVDALSGSR